MSYAEKKKNRSDFVRIFPWLVVLILGLVTMRNCGKNEVKSTTVHNVILEKVESLGKLELVRYKFKDIVEHEMISQWLPDPKALLIVSGEAVGCIDLGKVKKEDITVVDTILTIRLPNPELCYYKIDHKNSKVYQTNYAFLVEAQLVDEAYKKAEEELGKNALKAGILEQTKVSAEKVLTPFFAAFGYKKVIYEFK
ncbi:DUF4230 domain-containing protein [Solitalea canadensis]|uniref:DUF4230 domain-containing protein n=1 Tax=Solitalea canadensis (strain ATCC 29591 / DSM 3403 / JCM 21819 / LMG 8368 / NBRC 15130 / NCIMB 12057 / USAM 9D) TaxID=929556 RepID=H8KPP4_SOLCM|nr:DUF4230 domain-containing protein [Solitalea canadensis]AFD05942.1 hypothetical protein Solca_0825 [Solitalea canadensis DSM 3403]